MIEARKPGDDIILILSCRHKELSAFETLVSQSVAKSSHQNVQVKYHISGASSITPSELYHLGRVTASSLATLNLERRMSLCGSEVYAKGVLAALTENGVDGKEVHRESFAY